MSENVKATGNGFEVPAKLYQGLERIAKYREVSVDELLSSEIREMIGGKEPAYPEYVTFPVKIPRRVFNALDWYIRFTGYWVCNDSRDTSISEWIADAVEAQLESEKASKVPQACDFIAGELKNMMR